jgi:hypothetical protein
VRVLICGGRDYSDVPNAVRALDKLHKELMIEVVIEGDARGADRIAGYWARKRGITNLKYRVTQEDYAKHGRFLAPKVRNQRMLDEGKPQLVIAFPGHGGTADMVQRAERAGVPIRTVGTCSAP